MREGCDKAGEERAEAGAAAGALPPPTTAPPSSSSSSWWRRGLANGGKAVPTFLFLLFLGAYVALVLLPWLGLLVGRSPVLWCVVRAREYSSSIHT